MLKIHLVRHGETAYNAEGNKYCGRTNVELTEKGTLQAKKLALLLKDTEFDTIYSSPLIRAHTTAKIAVPNEEIHIDQRLIELDFGDWEGKTRSEFIQENKTVWDNWNQDPKSNPAGGSGETAEELILRLDDFLNDLLKKHKKGNVLIVAHNGVNRFLMAHVLGLDFRNYRKIVQENSSLTVLKYEQEEGFSLLKLNCRQGI